MSKATIIDNDLLKEEIKALHNYANRDEYNLNVVEVMINEIQGIVEGLKPCEETGSSKQIICPNCHSIKVSPVYELVNHDGDYAPIYMCEKCHKKFIAQEELDNDN